MHFNYTFSIFRIFYVSVYKLRELLIQCLLRYKIL